MSLGMEVGLSPGVFVLNGDPAPPPQKMAEPPPQFSAHVYCGQTAGWIKMPFGMEVGLGPGHIVLDGPLGREVGLNTSDIVLDGDQLPPPKRCTGHSFAQLLLLYSPLFVCERFCHSLHVVTGEHRYGSACSIHATKRRVVWPTCMCWRHPRTVVHALRCLGHSWCSGIQPSNAALLCMVLEPTVCCTSIAEICVALIQASAQGAFLGALKWCWRHLCRVSSFDVVVTSFSEFSVDYKCPD